MESEHEVEKNYSVAEFVAELRRLADTLEADGRFTIKIDEEDVTVPDTATASIAFEIDEGRAELEFQLSWETAAAEDEESEEEGSHQEEQETAG